MNTLFSSPLPFDILVLLCIEVLGGIIGVKKWMHYLEIQQLKEKGFSIAKIAKKLGVSRNTVYKYINKSPEEFDNWTISLGSREKKLDSYHDLILSWLREHPDLSGAQVHDWLIERNENIEVGESTVRSYVNVLREEHHIPKHITSRAYQAVEELPKGKQAQADFGETIVRTNNGISKKLVFIAFVLSHSRYKYVEWRDRPFTTRDVIQCHEAAFDYFGGMPEELVYDQDHLISVSENGRGHHLYQRVSGLPANEKVPCVSLP